LQDSQPKRLPCRHGRYGAHPLASALCHYATARSPCMLPHNANMQMRLRAARTIPTPMRPRCASPRSCLLACFCPSCTWRKDSEPQPYSMTLTTAVPNPSHHAYLRSVRARPLALGHASPCSRGPATRDTCSEVLAAPHIPRTKAAATLPRGEPEPPAEHKDRVRSRAAATTRLGRQPPAPHLRHTTPKRAASMRGPERSHARIGAGKNAPDGPSARRRRSPIRCSARPSSCAPTAW